MKYVLPKFADHLGSLGIVTCVGSNMLPGLGGHLDEIVVSLIGDCVGKQALQAVPVLAGAGDGGLNLESIATELLTALVGSMLIAILPFALRLRSPRSPTDVAALDALKAGHHPPDVRIRTLMLARASLKAPANSERALYKARALLFPAQPKASPAFSLGNRC